MKNISWLVNAMGYLDGNSIDRDIWTAERYLEYIGCVCIIWRITKRTSNEEGCGFAFWTVGKSDDCIWLVQDMENNGGEVPEAKRRKLDVSKEENKHMKRKWSKLQIFALARLAPAFCQ